eukprot:TRINITY_DN11971_c0_g2_i1.p1 TRINITY_DN11971_c0_g2~~TRINITY_DN11971_c0_g2_i1.p1  ORF type:complete len:103 (+),score=15.86 TRINITY_DN11971_c0_g2_i1:823-1131(+)
MRGLGEIFEESRGVCKALRSLPKTFGSKVTAIKESKDLNIMKIDELQGNLHTFELKFGKQKKKSVPLTAAHENTEIKEGSDEELETNDEVALLARRFRRFMQ